MESLKYKLKMTVYLCGSYAALPCLGILSYLRYHTDGANAFDPWVNDLKLDSHSETLKIHFLIINKLSQGNKLS